MHPTTSKQMANTEVSRNKFNSKFGYGRFVIDIGDMANALADELPNAGQLRYSQSVFIWDVQEDAAVVEVKPAYANSVCLDLPIEAMADHLNSLSNAALTSEGMTATDRVKVEATLARIERHLS